MHHYACAEIRGLFTGIGSLLPIYKVLGIEVRSSGLTASALICWAMSLTPTLSFLCVSKYHSFLLSPLSLPSGLICSDTILKLVNNTILLLPTSRSN